MERVCLLHAHMSTTLFCDATLPEVFVHALTPVELSMAPEATLTFVAVVLQLSSSHMTTKFLHSYFNIHSSDVCQKL